MSKRCALLLSINSNSGRNGSFNGGSGQLGLLHGDFCQLASQLLVNPFNSRGQGNARHKLIYNKSHGYRVQNRVLVCRFHLSG